MSSSGTPCARAWTPFHDWTPARRCPRAVFTTFPPNAVGTHPTLRNALNGGILPDGYYAQGEQRAGRVGPDLLALHADSEPDGPQPAWQVEESGLVTVADHPPKVSLSFEASSDAAFYQTKQRTLVIYHASGDRIVALIEIVSPANKHSRGTLEDFLDKAMAAIRAGYHLLVVDLFPPTRHDPEGMHGRIWEYLANESWQPPRDATDPGRVPSQAAGGGLRRAAHRGPGPARHAAVSGTGSIRQRAARTTYVAAYRGVPARWRRVIEASP